MKRKVLLAIILLVTLLTVGIVASVRASSSVKRTRTAASSGSQFKAPGSAGEYLLAIPSLVLVDFGSSGGQAAHDKALEVNL